MKHLRPPRNPILRDNYQGSMDNPSPSPNPSSVKHRNASRKQKYTKENQPPSDLTPMMPESSLAGKPSPKTKSLLPPRPPSSNPLKRKHSGEVIYDNGLPSSDSGVKVIVRVRPPTKDEQEGEMIVQKLSNDTLSIQGQTFTFDSIADSDATQNDIFQLVGSPLVENCLAGFNSSVFAYGQTGSGKTFTVWGPANALFEENLSSDQQGLTPRVFERLFARINEEEIKHTEKQLTYQCRCSFLEIYNEQITDLLDPSQGNLQIREDVSSGVYVENLTEEPASSMKDMKKLLMKGLSNRRIGSTSINAESSRSHSVFTCVLESRYKNPGDGLSCFKTSRINLVDLAGSERQKLTGAAGERLKEAGNINKSLSQLGNLINILAEISQTGKPRHIPYRDSRLTFLLQESLGGNAKLAMICAISPAQSCKNETWSTVRFAQRAKAIKNKAVVNEVMQDDVNTLREVIKQLRDELVRLKENVNQPKSNSSYSTGWNARRSLTLLKYSLSRPMTLPQTDDDSDEEMEIVEEEDQSGAINDQEDCDEGMSEPILGTPEATHIKKQGSLDMDDVPMEESTPENIFDHTKVLYSSLTNESENNNNILDGSMQNVFDDQEQLITTAPPSAYNPPEDKSNTSTTAPRLSSLIPFDITSELKSPTPSVSPRVTDSSRKSLRTSSMISASQKDSKVVSILGPKETSTASISTQTRNSTLRTEWLTSSIQRGLEVIGGPSQSPRISSIGYTHKPIDIGTQTIPQDYASEEEYPHMFLCGKCKTEIPLSEPQDLNGTSNMQIVPVEAPHSVGESMQQLPRAVEKVLAGSIRREMALEQFCAKQTQEIIHLNRLLQQYKHERECNAVIGQTREDKIVRLERLMDGILTAEEFKNEELVSLANEHKLLKEKYNNHPEILRTKLELRRVQEEMEQYKNFFELGEKDVLLEEIQYLRSQLQVYIDSSSSSATQKRRPFLQLTYSCDPRMATQLYKVPESVEEESATQKLEAERLHWRETESKWISLSEELKTELDASRSLADKWKYELDLEKRCTEELKEAMQLAMDGHARMLEQYAELEEKHIQMLVRHRRVQDGIEEVKKKAASAAKVRGGESKFIHALAAEISVLKVERERERRHLKDENKGLHAQLRDTAEAVQAAGELLVRLKEAEEEVTAAKRGAWEIEQEKEKAYKQINKMKKNHEKEISSLKRLLEEYRLAKKEETKPVDFNEPEVKQHDVAGETATTSTNSLARVKDNDDDDERWKEEFDTTFYNGDGEGEISNLTEPSWFSGYDRCNI
ncbi:kinesin-like protein KIN-12B [Impatiens glandulifera]|uniref:kinesin-like protein KIN-12B n=1 Tax=Impatiens glandulifera TaxID=253017 RepID=UPI001FB0D97B|nr:kinesin-like protein KIN-12B [Impatiens glandulifera]